MHRLMVAIYGGLTMLGGVFLPAKTSAQYVDFSNDRPFLIEADRLVRDVSFAPLVGTNYMAQLYYGPEGASPDSLVPLTTNPARFRSPTTTTPGTWIGNYRFMEGLAIGQIATLQVRVWDSTAGASWEEAVGAGFGETQHGSSALFLYQVPLTGPPAAFYIENFRGFTLVPEPSIVALAVSGAVVGVLLRRRK